MSCILSICIPTYNRPDQLLHTLSRLLPQMTEEAEIIILDNASEISGFNRVKDIVSKYAGPGHVELKKNKGNIGGNANILRCIEEGVGPWVWILGDDDLPDENAIFTILNHCNSYKNAAFVHFHTPHKFYNNRLSDMAFGRADQLLDHTMSVGELLFMSNCVLNRSFAFRHLLKGYHAIDSLIPHMAVMLWSISEDSPGILASSLVVRFDVNPGVGSSSYTLGVGLSKILELEWPEGVFTVFRKKLGVDFSRWTKGHVTLAAIVSKNLPYAQRKFKAICFLQRILWVKISFGRALNHRVFRLPFVLSLMLYMKRGTGTQPDTDSRL